jgi:hypothetical protein
VKNIQTANVIYRPPSRLLYNNEICSSNTGNTKASGYTRPEACLYICISKTRYGFINPFIIIIIIIIIIILLIIIIK